MLLLSCALSQSALAAALSPGDIVVAAQSSGDLYRVNPITGSVSLVRTGGLLFNPNHVLIDDRGRILTAERANTSGAIVRTDPATGIQESIASGFSYPVALSLDPNRNLYVGTTNTSNDIFHVNLSTGVKTPIASSLPVMSIQDIDVDAQGRLIVLDFGFNGSPSGRVLRVDPVSGASTTVASGGFLFNPADLLIHPSGDLLVSNRTDNGTQILRINPTTGAQQVVLRVPSEGWIALEDPNTILYADFHDTLSILRANLLTGATSTLTSFQFPHNLVGVAVYQVPEPSILLVGLICISAFSLSRRRRIA